MKNIFFTPGPAELYPTTISHFHNGLKNQIGSISHRSKQFQEIYQEVTTGLKKLLNIPEEYHIFILGSGTEGMERIIQNLVEKYSFHFVNGSFSKRFFVVAQELGKKPESLEVPFGQGFDFQNVVIPKETELICFTHNETSTGVMTPSVAINNIAKAHPDTLVAVDVVSSIPYVELDYKVLDAVFFSVQKGFGLPAGLGIVIISPRAIKKAEKLLQKGISIGSYHSFPSMHTYAKKSQTPETPPVLEMYVLAKVIEDMQKIGIATIRSEIDHKAQLLYDFLDSEKVLSAFVQEKKLRSSTIIVADIAKVKGDIKRKLAQKGFIVGSGYGAHKETQIRIANFPTHKIQDVETLIRHLKLL